MIIGDDQREFNMFWLLVKSVYSSWLYSFWHLLNEFDVVVAVLLLVYQLRVLHVILSRVHLKSVRRLGHVHPTEIGPIMFTKPFQKCRT